MAATSRGRGRMDRQQQQQRCLGRLLEELQQRQKQQRLKVRGLWDDPCLHVFEGGGEGLSV
jgi:hypothetical protein